ncbi:hypothetical protein [Paenibacillus sanguinis]|uniref:hypothetical protein n=1 Tax=Paenibacillus sanguinis TaxID=225906 RepID=UPI0003763C8B|nr:hypothetical protein [Paenibacillus sanguinis]
MRLLTARRLPRLSTDDYLDLLNLATRLGDQQWQKEIIRKLEAKQTDLSNVSQ